MVLETVMHTPFAQCLQAQATPSDRESDRKPRDLQTAALATGFYVAVLRAHARLRLRRRSTPPVAGQDQLRYTSLDGEAQ
jgi:hypothetical protein